MKTCPFPGCGRAARSESITCGGAMVCEEHWQEFEGKSAAELTARQRDELRTARLNHKSAVQAQQQSRTVLQWTVLRSLKAWKTWANEMALTEAQKPPAFPCLARVLMDSHENGRGEYLGVCELEQMTNALATRHSFSGDRATLFYHAGTASATLVSTKHGRHGEEPRAFPDAATALAWCQSERVHFVLLWPSATQGN